VLLSAVVSHRFVSLCCSRVFKLCSGKGAYTCLLPVSRSKYMCWQLRILLCSHRIVFTSASSHRLPAHKAMSTGLIFLMRRYHLAETFCSVCPLQEALHHLRSSASAHAPGPHQIACVNRSPGSRHIRAHHYCTLVSGARCARNLHADKGIGPWLNMVIGKRRVLRTAGLL
jgi:hypothetical protein